VNEKKVKEIRGGERLVSWFEKSAEEEFGSLPAEDMRGGGKS
jgi:hypothetical protein